METFSNRLRFLMQTNELSQKEIAKLTGISQGAISKYLNNLQEPKSKELYALSKALKVSMEQLCAGTESDYGSMDLISKWKERAENSEKKLGVIISETSKIQKDFERLKELWGLE